MVDVCVLVEGAYPYVTGGVSSWLHALISNLPDLSFSIVCISAYPDSTRKILYRLPDNVIEFREIFINDFKRVQKSTRTAYNHAVNWQGFQTVHEAIAVGRPYQREQLLSLLRMPGLAGITMNHLLQAPESWKQLLHLYETHAGEEPFADFFWTFRLTYLPIFTICETVLPDAQVYHSISTGYCGLLGALTRLRTGRPFLLTEHGLYTREREIEIAQSTWMSKLERTGHNKLRRLGFFQQWWLNIYRFMERLTYEQADAVISITGVNQQHQLLNGADQRKLLLIPNGINVEQLAHLRNHDLAQDEYEVATQAVISAPFTHDDNGRQPYRIGFVGRIVPIKDVKTFIRAIKIAQQRIPHLEAYLVGPTEEDPLYYQECLRLVELLELQSVITFTGQTDVREYYKKIDVLVLTSVSEGQPLVVLEANCAGIPVIASNVGACSELLLGITSEDRALGASGIITPVASPLEAANAIIQLWRNEALRLRMGRAGQERVQRFYRQEQLYHSYHQLYSTWIARGRNAADDECDYTIPRMPRIMQQTALALETYRRKEV